MRAAVKTGVVLLPFVLVFLGIRACSQGEAQRWLARAQEFDPAAQIVVDEDDLIVIAPDEAGGLAATRELRAFRERLDAYGDIVGRPFEHRMVCVFFTNADMVRAYAGQQVDAAAASRLHGYTDPAQGAMFLPMELSYATLRHETVHWVMGTTTGGLVRHSPWLSEGMAQLFEGDQPGIGKEEAEAARMLQGRLDVDRLLELQNYSLFLIDNGARNYLESLVLTAFLWEKRDRELLAQYVEGERAIPDNRQALFQGIYKHDQEPFRRDLREFLRTLR